ncbi:hypothetical protein BJX64DRAFT_273728 [Aspergillus heterothallicus]
MNPSQIYACALGGIIAYLVTCWVVRYCARQQRWLRVLVRPGRYLYRKVIFYLLRHVIYPQCIYWAGMLTCNFLVTRGLRLIAARSGHLAVINFIPLILAGRLSLAADILGLPIQSYIRTHGTFGTMVCVQTIMHVATSMRNRDWAPQSPALSAFALSMALLVIRRCLYEVFIKLHYMLALIALFAIWRHIRVQRIFAHIYILIASGILVGTTLVHWVTLVVRNLIIPVNRPFTVYAGMWVYIWIPGVSPFLMFHSHPFMVTWWEENSQGKATTEELLTWIDGPYGEPVDLLSYNNVLLVASGIGIVSQISYIRELLKSHLKRIYVAWELDDESNLNWVYHWMNQLLYLDRKSLILRFGIHIPSSPDSPDAPEPWNSTHDRIWKLPGEIQPWKVVTKEFWSGTGTSLVTGIKEAIQSNMQHVVDLLKLPFQPGSTRIQKNANIPRV